MITLGSLCSGAGGLDLAIPAQHAWVAETDPDASRVLAHRFGAPNLGDITTVDWRTVERVDILAAGFPCQDISNAGKRAGIEGARSGVWSNVAAAVGVLRPRLVLVENVSALLVRGGTRVVADLAGLGYVGSWLSIRASDVGAPHQRNRVFLAATPTDADGEPLRLEPVAVGAREPAAVAGGGCPGPLMPTPTAELGRGAGMAGTDLAAARRAAGRRMLDDAVALLPTPRASEGAKGGPNQRGSADLTLTSSVMLLPTPTATRSRNATSGRTDPKPTTNTNGWTLHDVAYADRWAQYGPAIARWTTILDRPAPDPTVTGKRGGRRLSARFVEWLMGWPEGWVTDLVDNTAALRLCGNGVVPLQAAAAYSMLGEF